MGSGLEIAIILLAVIIVFQQFMHKRTVDKLLDRLMARDLPELKAVDRPPTTREAKSLSDRKEYELNAKKRGEQPEAEEV